MDSRPARNIDGIALGGGMTRAFVHSYMRTFIQDLRYGLRLLARSPGFTAIALLTLTLGIGATAAIFSVVDAVLLRGLPYRDPQRLVSVFEDISAEGFPRNTPAPGNYADWKAQTRIFEDVAAAAEGGRFSIFNLTGGPGGQPSEPEKLQGASVTQNLFSVLGARPALGRVFRPEEDRPGGPRVVLMSHGLWMRRFAGDPATVGRAIVLNGEKYTVLGVMPAGFAYPSANADLWTPIALTNAQMGDRGAHYLEVVAGLRPGVTLAQANAGLQVLATRLARAYPDTNGLVRRFFAEPLQDTYTQGARTGLIVLMAAVGFILLIACANIANLLLARATGRQREIAVRTALGAARSRILRQMLTESALLAAGGGLLGVVLADWCFSFLKNLIPADLTRSASLALDPGVLAFAVGISLASSLLFGMAPALQVSRIDLNGVLKEGGRGNVGPRRGMLRDMLVIGEVALSLVLLVGSGLLLKSFAKLRGLDPGFRADHVLTVRVDAPMTKYGDFTKRAAFFERVVERVRTLPGVQAAGFTSALPLTWEGGSSGFTPEGVAPRPDVSWDANNRVVSAGYFEAMRIPLRRGRLFRDSDGPDAPPVVIVNETMARKFWPNQDALGKRFKFGGPGDEAPWLRIAGIVGDVRQMRLNEPPRQEMYFPYWQAKDNWMVPRDLAIRTSGDPLSLAGAVRQAVWSIDKDQPVSNIMTLDNLLDQEVAQRRVQAALLGGLAALALILACIGIYGVLSYLVTQRTREIGVRVALGASAADVFRTVAGQGMALTGIGVAAGLTGALALSHMLGSLLFGVGAGDPLTYAVAVAVFGGVALLACYFPARRAARVDPMVTLRYE
jgi:putative ABC transport system permease protein